MSILIKGINKPKSCFNCGFNMYDCHCKINSGKIDRDDWTCDKPCPIVEVPTPHGDLIDIESKISIGIRDGVKTVRELLNDKAVRLPKIVIKAEVNE